MDEEPQQQQPEPEQEVKTQTAPDDQKRFVTQFDFEAVDKSLANAEIPEWRRQQLRRMRRVFFKRKARNR